MALELILRILCGALLGGAIGFEREYRAKEAGFRTHFLVALGSTLFMVISQYGFDMVTWREHVSHDPARVAAQVVSGIGFIGAGTIIFQRHVVKGLTTAAGLWATSAIGLCIGGGLWVVGIVSTVAVLVGLETTHFLISRVGYRTMHVRFRATSQEDVQAVMHRIKQLDVVVESYDVSNVNTNNGLQLAVEMEIKLRRKYFREGVTQFMAYFDGVFVEHME